MFPKGIFEASFSECINYLCQVNFDSFRASCLVHENMHANLKFVALVTSPSIYFNRLCPQCPWKRTNLKSVDQTKNGTYYCLTASPTPYLYDTKPPTEKTCKMKTMKTCRDTGQ